jgi:hypothetical protein
MYAAFLHGIITPVNETLNASGNSNVQDRKAASNSIKIK